MKIPRRSRRSISRRPGFDSLEGRQLLSGAGALDPTFGGVGSVVVPLSTSFQTAGPSSVVQSASVVQPDGKVILGGTIVQGGALYTALARVNPDGSRDTSFAMGGEFLLAGAQGVSQILVQPNGKIDIIGTGSYPVVYVIQLNSAGLLDASFGHEGVVQIPLTMSNGANATRVHLAGGAVDTSGNVIVAGDVQVKAQGNLGLGGEVDDLVVARLTPTGALDSSFNGSGIEKIPVAIGQYTEDTAAGVFLQPDGKIVVGGSAIASYGIITTTNPITYPPQSQPIAVRLLTDGTLDTSFGASSTTPGEVTFPPQPSNLSAVGTVTVTGVVDDHGRIVLLANETVGGVSGPVLYGLNGIGSLDRTFGSGGVVQDPFSGTYTALAFDNQGRLLLGGTVPLTSGDDYPGTPPVLLPTVVRLNADGTVDTSFDGARYGSLGEAGVDFANGVFTQSFGSLAVEPDGSIVVAGKVDANLGGARVPTFAVARVEPSSSPTPGSAGGAPDPNFAVYGGAAVPVATNFQSNGPSSVTGGAVAVQADGKVLVGGTIEQDNLYYVTLARLEPDGVRDTTFGQAGEALFASEANIASVLTQTDGKILVVGNTVGFTNGLVQVQIPEFFAVRFNIDGSLDTTYSNHGVAQFPIADAQGSASIQVHVASALLDGSDNLVIVGDALVSGTIGLGQNQTDLVVARVTPAGALDTTFNGSGIVKVPVAINGFLEDGSAGIALKPDGQLVVGGSAVAAINTISSGSLVTQVATDQPIVVRLNNDGSLDPNFGTGGIVILPTATNASIPAGSVMISALTLDGGQIVLGGLKSRAGGPLDVLFRLNLDGSIDSGFGNSGEVLASDGSGITALAVDLSGRIVAANGAEGTVYRFTPAGTIDATFGNGGGKLDYRGRPAPDFGNRSTVGLDTIFYDTTSNSTIGGLAISPLTGDVVVAGTTFQDYGTGNSNAALVPTFAAAELVPTATPAPVTPSGTNSGEPDPTFGTAGTATVKFPLDPAAVAQAEAIQPNGDILLAGKELARLLPSGVLDTSFGIGGTQSLLGGTVTASSVFILPNGEVEVFGYVGGSELPILLRYTTSGQPDNSFGTGGEVSYPSPAYGLFPAQAKATMEPDGRVIVSGAYAGAVDTVRLNLDGSLDTNFGNGGAEITPISTGSSPSPSIAGIAIQPDGEIVIAGNIGVAPAPDGTEYTNVFALRLNPSGLFETTFGGQAGGGIVLLHPQPTNPSALDYYSISGVTLEKNGQIVLGGSTGGNIVVTMLNADGTYDAGFGHLGQEIVPVYQAVTAPVNTAGANLIQTGGVIVEPDGSIVVAATVVGNIAGYPGTTTGILAARFNSDGPPVSYFGQPITPAYTPGVAVYVPGGMASDVTSILVQANGSLLLAGDEHLGTSTVFAVTRVN